MRRMILAAVQHRDVDLTVDAVTGMLQYAALLGVDVADFDTPALAMVTTADEPRSHAWLLKAIGDRALARSDHQARIHYDTALRLYRQVGAVLGEANCIKSLGDIALARSDHDQARRHYDTALRLYERIKEPYSIGMANRRLARLAGGVDEKSALVAAARLAWASIGRPDLVAALDAEFE